MQSYKTVDEYMESLTTWKHEVSMLREIALSTGLDEGIKWGGPCYMYRGKNVVGLAAFKGYAGLWFFQGGLLEDKAGFLMNAQDGVTKAMRQWRFSSADEIKKAPITEYIFESIENFKNGQVIKPTAKSSSFETPAELNKALQAHPVMLEIWNSFPPSHRREYAEYVAEAKKEDTRQRRVEKVLEQINKRQGLNDKYKK